MNAFLEKRKLRAPFFSSFHLETFTFMLHDHRTVYQALNLLESFQRQTGQGKERAHGSLVELYVAFRKSQVSPQCI